MIKGTKDTIIASETPAVPNCNSSVNGSSSALDAEKIVAVTFRNGVPYMAVKWKGSQTADFVDVREIRAKWPLVLIAFYEANLVISQKDGDDRRLVEESDLDSFVERCQNNFPVQYTTPKAILASVKSKGELFLAVTWDGIDTVSCIPAPLAHHWFPELLISFYESKIVWK